ncbi:uncharacterized protein J5M81_009451 [Pluvialis apricaria]
MRRRERPPEGRGSPGRPDLLRHEASPLPPVYLSFFEEECRAIVGRLRLGHRGRALPGPVGGQRPVARRHRAPHLHAAPPRGDPAQRRAARGGAARTPPPRARPAGRPATSRLLAGLPARRRPLPAWLGPGRRRGAEPGSSPPAHRAPAGRSLPAGRSPGRRGGGRGSLARARGGGRALELPKAGKGLGAPGTRPPRSPGAKTKLMPAAKSRLGHPSGAWQPAQPSTIPKAAPRDTEAAVKVGGRRQPSQRLSTAIPTVASRSRLCPLGKAASPKRFCLASSTQELICNRTWELKENGESKEGLVAAGTVLGVGEADQTWVCVGSSSSKLAPGLTPGCGDAVPAEQPAGDQLSQELKRVKNELERVKGELADKTAQCEAYRQTISSLQAQLRAAGAECWEQQCFDGAVAPQESVQKMHRWRRVVTRGETDVQNMGTDSQQPLVRPPEPLRQ